MQVATDKNTLTAYQYSEHIYNLVKTNKKLDKIVKSNGSAEKIMLQLEKMEGVVTAFEKYMENFEKDVQFLGLGQAGWNWIKFGANSVMALATLAPLGTNIGESVETNYNNSHYGALISNISSTTVSVIAYLVYLCVMGLDHWRDKKIESNSPNANNQKTLVEFWRNLNDLKKICHQDKLTPNDTEKIDHQFDKCSKSLSRIKIDQPEIEKNYKEKFASMQIDALPNQELLSSNISQIKQIFLKQKELFLQYEELEKKMTDLIEVKNVKVNSETANQKLVVNENAESSSQTSSILDIHNTDQSPLRQSQYFSRNQTKTSIADEYNYNFLILSEKFGFKIDNLYIQGKVYPGNLQANDPSTPRSESIVVNL